jgi:hypothetical protein
MASWYVKSDTGGAKHFKHLMRAAAPVRHAVIKIHDDPIG